MPERPICLPGLPAVRLRRHPRARHIRLRYAPDTGGFTLTTGPDTRMSEIKLFLDDRRDWITARANQPVARTPLAPGRQVPILDRPHRIALDAGTGAPLHRDGQLLLPAGTADPQAASLRYLKTLAREHLSARAHAHATRLQPARTVRSVQIRDQRSCWGSCSGRGTLSFNWRLIMAPWLVLDYLAAHEVAHLLYFDHSPAFWQTCRALAPETDRAEAWLKRHGRELNLYGPPRG
jgi:hypothetical protein